MKPTNPRRWFVAATRSNRERIARAQLLNQDFAVFLPVRNRTLRRPHRMVTGLAPLFPGYLFLAFDPVPSAIRAVNGTRGIKHLLSSGEAPSALPENFVESLQAAIGADGAVSHRFMLNPGDRIEIASGPLACQMGELLRMDDRGRVTVLLELLSGKVPVAIDAANLLPA